MNNRSPVEVFTVNECASVAVSQSRPLRIVAASGARASYRFLEFFTVKICNAHTRRAYSRAAGEFFDSLAVKGVTQLDEIASIHVATYIEELSRARSAPTAKQRLAALRHLFDWMVIGQIMPTKPAAAVRGPLHIVRRGKTPVLDPAEARQLINAIDATTVIGSRDRALIGLMGLILRAHRRGDRHARRGRVHAEPQAMGSLEREGRQANTPCRATTTLNSTCMPISTAGASRTIRRRFCFRPTVQSTQPAHRQSPAPSQRLRDDLKWRAKSAEHHHAHGQPYVSGDGRYSVSEKRRHPRTRGAQMANHASTRTTQLSTAARRR